MNKISQTNAIKSPDLLFTNLVLASSAHNNPFQSSSGRRDQCLTVISNECSHVVDEISTLLRSKILHASSPM